MSDAVHHGGALSEEHVRHVKAQVKGYLVVFAALAGLTVATVAAAHLPVPGWMHIAIALVIAAVKGGLVAAYFMHLISERVAIFWVLGLTALFFVFLVFLPLMGYWDPIKLDYM